MTDENAVPAAVYVQTNDATKNEVVAYDRSESGKLEPQGRYETGGLGSGRPHLASQSSVVLSDDNLWLLVANTGSDDLSLFAVVDGGLRLSDRVVSGGSAPTSVGVHGDTVYVLNTGGDEAAPPNITGFKLVDGALRPLTDSTRPLSADDADPAQISFSPDGRTLVVTERGTNSISSYAVDEQGYAEGPTTIKSTGATPYGFDFTPKGVLVVTEAFGGEIGAAAASTYTVAGRGRLGPVSASVADTRSEVCWAAVTKDGRHAYVTNFGDGTISSYGIGTDGTLELVESIAGSTRLGEKGIRDEALSSDGRYLYALDADAQKVFGWSVIAGGKLEPLGEADGLPETVAGLAAS
jgi:6-phosphogluconolactonase